MNLSIACMFMMFGSKIFKLQSVSRMYDVSIGHNNFEFICMILNKNIHDHYTQGSAKVHINTVSSLDTRNFVYHRVLNWNNCPQQCKLLPKEKFISQYKCLMFSDM